MMTIANNDDNLELEWYQDMGLDPNTWLSFVDVNNDKKNDSNHSSTS